MKSYLLLTLLPVPKFTHPNMCLHGVLEDWLLHQVISIVVKPLKKATEVGCMMSDLLSKLKHCFTPLTTYIAKTPKQHVIAHVTSNVSAITMAMSQQFGNPIHCAAHTASTVCCQLIASKEKSAIPTCPCISEHAGNFSSMPSRLPSGSVGLLLSPVPSSPQSDCINTSRCSGTTIRSGAPEC